VRSTNWRMQDEQNGIFRIEDCREFYRRLRTAGLGECSHLADHGIGFKRSQSL
jgi:hypothetical protein